MLSETSLRPACVYASVHRVHTNGFPVGLLVGQRVPSSLTAARNVSDFHIYDIFHYALESLSGGVVRIEIPMDKSCVSSTTCPNIVERRCPPFAFLLARRVVSLHSPSLSRCAGKFLKYAKMRFNICEKLTGRFSSSSGSPKCFASCRFARRILTSTSTVLSPLLPPPLSSLLLHFFTERAILIKIQK